VSHAKERKERNCLNCNAVVEDRYCGVCGQENLEPQETAGHLVGHFFNDITHFDGKFFSSMKYLLTKPGFLSKEYVAGRRASYLNPVRMYVFTSFIFFLIFFSFVIHESPERAVEKNAVADTTAVANDSANASAIPDIIINDNSDTLKRSGKKRKTNKGLYSMFFNNLEDYRDRKEYDSLIDAGKVDDGIFNRMMVRKKISLKERYGDDTKAMGEKLDETLLHNVPQMFFLSLPLFALFLKLLYVRRKKFYYVAHAIFTIHLYIAVYIIALAIFLTNYLSEFQYLGWLNFVRVLLVIYIFYYAYKAMRNFYEQGRFKTILKYILIFFWLLFLLVLLSIVLVALSVYKL
jgi:hypothetical protein